MILCHSELAEAFLLVFRQAQNDNDLEQSIRNKNEIQCRKMP
jgi:hypothetical protein